MRVGTLTRALLVVLSLAAAAGPAVAKRTARLRSVSPDGRLVAEVRDGAWGESLSIADAPRWPASAHAPRRGTSLSVTSALTWSPSGDALAFTWCDSSGQAQLVVLLVDGAGAPATLSWPIPATARPASAIMWVGPTRVGAGPNTLQPKMLVSWEVDSAR